MAASARRAPQLQSVQIERMGADGDGVTPLPDGTSLYAPNTLPGEWVQPGDLTRRGDGWTAAATIIEPASDRAVPPCPHFGLCGGCTVQHWRDSS